MGNRATRRNISLTDLEIDKYLDTVQNVSSFVQEALRHYINDYVEVEYVKLEDFKVTKDDIKALKNEFKILNENYKEQQELLYELSKVFLEGK